MTDTPEPIFTKGMIDACTLTEEQLAKFCEDSEMPAPVMWHDQIEIRAHGGGKAEQLRQAIENSPAETKMAISRAMNNFIGAFRSFEEDAVGHWWASFVVTVEDGSSIADGSIGIDWGVKVIATATDSKFDLPHEKHALGSQMKLTRYQRMMARRIPKPGQSASNRYKHAKHQTATLHRKVRWQRADAAKKWAKRIVDNHDQIAIEDFKPKFMTKNHKLARTAADAGVGIAKRELLQRAERAGRTVVLVPPAYTSMTCSSCGTRAKARLELKVRTFHCDHCGHIEDRDRNAAKVILAAAGFNGACVEDVRPESLEATAV